MCINRFDEDTKTSFLDLYSKVDSEVVIEDESAEKTEKVEEVKEDHTPF